MGYKSYVASYGSEVSSSLLPVSKTATIDKTLFYVNRSFNYPPNPVNQISVRATNCKSTFLNLKSNNSAFHNPTSEIDIR
jgi:hypothetical protein